MMFAELPGLEQFHQELLPKLTGKTVSCAFCGKTVTRITGAHLTTHRDQLEPLRKTVPKRKSQDRLDIERREFPEKEPKLWTTRPERLVETYRRVKSGTDPMTALVDQTFRLYHPKKSEWLLMDHRSLKADWTTVKLNDTGWPWFSNRLSAGRLKEHFLGNMTIGVHPHNGMQSYVLVFDVDGYQQANETAAQAEWRVKNITRILVRLLRRHHLEPHVSASGAKGYHVSLFFNAPLSITKAERLYQYFIQHPELPTEGTVIECLPFSHGLKLPLGINWHTKRFCSFVEPYSLMPVPDPHQYYLDIQPLPLDKTLSGFTSEPTAKSARSKKGSTNTRYCDSELSKAYYDGIQARGTRHVTTLKATAFCLQHHKPENEIELLERMVAWSKNQYTQHRIHIKTPWFEHERDLKRIVWYAWDHPLSEPRDYGVWFTTADVHWIRSKTDDLKAQRLLLAALFQFRLSGDEFHFGYERMGQLTRLAKDSRGEALHELRKRLGILKKVKNYSHQTGYFKSHSTVYRLTETPDEKVISTNLVRVNEKSWSVDLWYDLLKLVFSASDLRKLYPFSWHRIVRSTPGNTSCTA